MYRNLRIAAVALLLLPTSLLAQTAHLNIDATASVSPVSPSLYGLMTEEINYSYDGGLYAEMVRNRTFHRDWDGFEHWAVVTHGNAQASISNDDSGPSKALSHSMKITITAATEHDDAGVSNDGYWGMEIRPNTVYQGSYYAKSQGVGNMHIRIVSNDTGAVLAQLSEKMFDGQWTSGAFGFTTGKNIPAGKNNHLEITFSHPGTVDLQLVSLFPPTYNNRDNGNRPDIMQMMAAMHPHFLRLPGGNYLEGDTIAERFDWKSTIGRLVDRPTHRSPWGYTSTDGMGLLEFLEWCEDLHIEPVLAVYAGYSLHGDHVTGDKLKPFVQDALDEIEYVTGSTDTKWGAVRAHDGHPMPFPLHYIEIGNEDQFDKSGSYDERFHDFATAIRARYPQYKLIATTPVKSTTPDAIDDHFYETPEQFFALVHHYDEVPRNGPKIFVGEWATRTGSPTPNFGAALGDAAWMTSMERNSDLIVMASYAPLFTNVNPGGMQWSTDLIGYNAESVYGSPAYYAQVLFAGHLGDHTVRTTADGLNPRFFYSATVSTDQKLLHLKLVNASDRPQPLMLNIAGAISGSSVDIYTLHAATRWATNTIEHPDFIQPTGMKEMLSAKEWRHDIPGNTIQVMDIQLK